MSDSPSGSLPVRDVLRTVHLFRGLANEEMERIVALSEERAYPAGSLIFEEGAPGDAFFVILSGSVRISKFIPTAGEEAMAIMERGSYFGEMSLIDEFPRSARATAHTDCRLVAISRKDFADLLAVDRELAVKFLWFFCKTLSFRLRETNEKIASLFAIARTF